MAKLAELDSGRDHRQPIFAIAETTLSEESSSEIPNRPDDQDQHGATVLQRISADKAKSTLSKLVVPVAMLHERKTVGTAGSRGLGSHLARPSSGGFDRNNRSISSAQMESSIRFTPSIEPWQMLRCINLGAVDVLSSPLTEDRIANLAIHAYRATDEAQKERSALLATKRLRKRSWVGFDDKKPYAYLREQM